MDGGQGWTLYLYARVAASAAKVAVGSAVAITQTQAQ